MSVTRRRFAGLGIAAVGALLGPSVARARSRPTISSVSASDVTSTTATVLGTVNPNGRHTSAWFEYGLTTAYGSQTTAQDIGSGRTAQPLAASLSNLGAGQTYHVRIRASQ